MDATPFLAVNAVGATVAVAAWFAGSWTRRRGRWFTICLLSCACLLICIKSALYQFPVVEAALFPFTWYVWLQDYWVVLFAVLFFAMVIPQIPASRDRKALALLLGMLLVMGGHRTWWMLRPEVHGQESCPDTAHHLTQSTPYTCAPCACAIALSYVGIIVSERQMASLSLTRATGTTVFNSYRGLMLALEGTAWTPVLRNRSIDDLIHPGQVAVIDFPHLRHALAIHGDGDHFTVHDPLAIEPKIRSREWVAKYYGGLALMIEPR